METNKYLLCEPKYFDIEYSINKWMDVNNKVNKEKAYAQWNYFVSKLKELGCKIELIEPKPGLPDMTFAGDEGLVYGKKVILSSFRYKERQGETEHYKKWFQDNGYEIIEMPKGIVFEGLGDIIYNDKKIVFGFGPRSDPVAIDFVKKIMSDLEVVCELEIVDKEMFHLALSLSFIDDDTVMYYPKTFSKESIEIIKSKFKNAISVSDSDALDYFACNNVIVGKNILIWNCSDELEKKLNAVGYNVIKCDMSEFFKSGGSLRCLVLKL